MSLKTFWDAVVGMLVSEEPRHLGDYPQGPVRPTQLSTQLNPMTDQSHESFVEQAEARAENR